MKEEELRLLFGKSMASATRRVRSILSQQRLRVPFQDEEMEALMKFHPRRLRKFDHFMMDRSLPYHRICLFVMKDGVGTQCSWQKCIRNMYGRYNRERIKRQHVIHAFRCEISDSPKMRAAKAKYGVKPCAACSKVTKLHIDHHSKPFSQILDEFLESSDVGMGDVQLEYKTRPFRILCRKLARRWIDWHDEQAVLVGLCRSCNSAKGSSGYKHR